MRMFWPRVLAVFPLGLLLGSCGKETGSVQNFRYRWVTLPDGAKIRAELAARPEDLLRGMQYREHLAEDHGMLFVHSKEGYYPYWMHKVRIPLDIIWLDKDRRIVQVVHRAPPCRTEAAMCPSYGGGFLARFVLELNAGMGDKHKMEPGAAVEFAF